MTIKCKDIDVPLLCNYFVPKRLQLEAAHSFEGPLYKYHIIPKIAVQPTLFPQKGKRKYMLKIALLTMQIIKAYVIRFANS